MATAISSAGITFKYGVETTAGTKPSSFVAISGVTAFEAYNSEPNVGDCTPLAETSRHRYIKLLADDGGVFTLTANLTDGFQTAWEALVSAYATGQTSGYDTWFEVAVPGLTDKFYFTGEPQELGLMAGEVDSVLTIDAYIAVDEVKGWQ